MSTHDAFLKKIPTISLSAKFSILGVIMVLWMRNLSLHFVFRGDSSLRPGSMTRRTRYDE